MIDFIKKILKKAKNGLDPFNLRIQRYKKAGYFNQRGEYIEEEEGMDSWNMGEEDLPPQQTQVVTPPESAVNEQSIDSIIQQIGPESLPQGKYKANVNDLLKLYQLPVTIFSSVMRSLTEDGKLYLQDISKKNWGMDVNFDRDIPSWEESAEERLSPDGITKFLIKNPQAMMNFLNKNEDVGLEVANVLRFYNLVGTEGMDGAVRLLSSANPKSKEFNAVSDILERNLPKVQKEVSEEILRLSPEILKWVFSGYGGKSYEKNLSTITNDQDEQVEFEDPNAITPEDQYFQGEYVDEDEMGGTVDPRKDMMLTEDVDRTEQKRKIRENINKTSLDAVSKTIGEAAFNHLNETIEYFPKISSDVGRGMYQNISKHMQEIRKSGYNIAGEKIAKDIMKQTMDYETSILYFNAIHSQIRNLLNGNGDYHDPFSREDLSGTVTPRGIVFENSFGQIVVPIEYTQSFVRAAGIGPEEIGAIDTIKVDETVQKLKGEESVNKMIVDSIAGKNKKGLAGYKTTMYMYEDMLVSKNYIQNLITNVIPPDVVLNDEKLKEMSQIIMSLPFKSKENNFIKERIFSSADIKDGDSESVIINKLNAYLELNYLQLIKYGSLVSVIGRSKEKIEDTDGGSEDTVKRERLSDTIKWFFGFKKKLSDKEMEYNNKIDILEAEKQSDPSKVQKNDKKIAELRKEMSLSFNSECMSEFKCDKDTLQISVFSSICAYLDKYARQMRRTPDGAKANQAINQLLPFLVGAREDDYREFKNSPPMRKLEEIEDPFPVDDILTGRKRGRYLSEVYYSIKGEQVPPEVQERINFFHVCRTFSGSGGKLLKEYNSYLSEKASGEKGVKKQLMKLRSEIESKVNDGYQELNRILSDPKNSLAIKKSIISVSNIEKDPEKINEKSKNLHRRWSDIINNPDKTEDLNFYKDVLSQSQPYKGKTRNLSRYLSPLIDNKPAMSLNQLLNPETKNLKSISDIDYYLSNQKDDTDLHAKQQKILQDMNGMALKDGRKLIDMFDLKKLKLAYILFKSMMKKYSYLKFMADSMRKFASSKNSADKIEYQMRLLVEDFVEKLNHIIN